MKPSKKIQIISALILSVTLLSACSTVNSNPLDGAQNSKKNEQNPTMNLKQNAGIYTILINNSTEEPDENPERAANGDIKLIISITIMNNGEQEVNPLWHMQLETDHITTFGSFTKDTNPQKINIKPQEKWETTVAFKANKKDTIRTLSIIDEHNKIVAAFNI